MLRNDLITWLSSQGSNDAVVVDVGGELLDVDAVTAGNGCIVLVLGKDETPAVRSSAETAAPQ